jgi:hypothetical protein
MAAEEAAPVGEFPLEATLEVGDVEGGEPLEGLEVGKGAVQASALALPVLHGLHERGCLATAGRDGGREVGELTLDLAKGGLQAVALGVG